MKDDICNQRSKKQAYNTCGALNFDLFYLNSGMNRLGCLYISLFGGRGYKDVWRAVSEKSARPPLLPSQRDAPPSTAPSNARHQRPPLPSPRLPSPHLPSAAPSVPLHPPSNPDPPSARANLRRGLARGSDEQVVWALGSTGQGGGGGGSGSWSAYPRASFLLRPPPAWGSWRHPAASVRVSFPSASALPFQPLPSPLPPLSGRPPSLRSSPFPLSGPFRGPPSRPRPAQAHLSEASTGLATVCGTGVRDARHTAASSHPPARLKPPLPRSPALPLPSQFSAHCTAYTALPPQPATSLPTPCPRPAEHPTTADPALPSARFAPSPLPSLSRLPSWHSPIPKPSPLQKALLFHGCSCGFGFIFGPRSCSSE